MWPAFRSEISRQIGAMRDELTDATDSHRRQMLDFRQESAALLHETNSTLTGGEHPCEAHGG